eukprot:4526726-Alexandrium_andersonii.AAC.1
MSPLLRSGARSALRGRPNLPDLCKSRISPACAASTSTGARAAPAAAARYRDPSWPPAPQPGAAPAR